MAGAGAVVAAGLTLGVGVPGGSNIRPRRCDAVGEAEDTGGVVPTLGGVVIVGVDAATGAEVCDGDAVIDGNGVDVDDVVPPVAGGVAFSGAAPFTNFRGGAFGGGVASDFIFCRILFASS